MTHKKNDEVLSQDEMRALEVAVGISPPEASLDEIPEISVVDDYQPALEVSRSDLDILKSTAIDVGVDLTDRQALEILATDMNIYDEMRQWGADDTGVRDSYWEAVANHVMKKAGLCPFDFSHGTSMEEHEKILGAVREAAPKVGYALAEDE